jgi:hypothetical protein
MGRDKAARGAVRWEKGRGAAKVGRSERDPRQQEMAKRRCEGSRWQGQNVAGEDAPRAQLPALACIAWDSPASCAARAVHGQGARGHTAELFGVAPPKKLLDCILRCICGVPLPFRPPLIPNNPSHRAISHSAPLTGSSLLSPSFYSAPDPHQPDRNLALLAQLRHHLGHLLTPLLRHTRHSTAHHSSAPVDSARGTAPHCCCGPLGMHTPWSG